VLAFIIIEHYTDKMPYIYNHVNYQIITVGSSKYIINKCKNAHWSKGLLLYSNSWKSHDIRNTLLMIKMSGCSIVHEYKAINTPSIQNEKWGYVPRCFFFIKNNNKLKYLLSRVFWGWWQYGLKYHRNAQQIINYKSHFSKISFIQIFCWIGDWNPALKIHEKPETLFKLRIFFPLTWIKLQKKFLIKNFFLLNCKKKVLKIT